MGYKIHSLVTQALSMLINHLTSRRKHRGEEREARATVRRKE
jgi:hypothetical protein